MRDFDLVSGYKDQRVPEVSRNALVQCALITVRLAAMKRGDWNAFCREFRVANCADTRVLLPREIGD